MSTVAIGNLENPRKVRKFDACQENVGGSVRENHVGENCLLKTFLFTIVGIANLTFGTIQPYLMDRCRRCVACFNDFAA